MLFKKKHPKDLEEIVNQIRVDLSNNYKDDALAQLKKLRESVESKKSSSNLSDSDAEYYNQLITLFEDDIKHFKRTY